jgi:hypothetical protein
MIKYVVGMLSSLYLSMLSINADVNCRDLASYPIQWEILLSCFLNALWF